MHDWFSFSKKRITTEVDPFFVEIPVFEIKKRVTLHLLVNCWIESQSLEREEKRSKMAFLPFLANGKNYNLKMPFEYTHTQPKTKTDFRSFRKDKLKS